MKKIFLIFPRVYLLYVIGFLLLYFVLDLRTVLFKTRLVTLNRLRPESVDHLIRIAEDPSRTDRAKLERSHMYYANVFEALPDRVDALGMLGFCSYHLGNTSEAIRDYQKAIELNPIFFWFPYNIGVIYLKDGQYEKSIASFKKALESPPEAAIAFIKSSIRIYLPVIATRSGGDIEGEIRNELKRGYTRAYWGMILSYENLKDYQNMFSVSFLAIKSGLDDNGLFSYYAGRAAYELKDYERAIYFLQEALKKDSNLKEAYEYLAAILRSVGKEGAARLFELKKDQLKEVTSLPTPKSLSLEIY